MSFEGYYQHLCKNGHYNTEDCNTWFPDDDYSMCHCGEPIVWFNLVDVTNGSYEMVEEVDHVYGGSIWRETKKRIDGYIELEKIEERCCDKCGSLLEARFKVPKIGGHKVRRRK